MELIKLSTTFIYCSRNEPGFFTACLPSLKFYLFILLIVEYLDCCSTGTQSYLLCCLSGDWLSSPFVNGVNLELNLSFAEYFCSMSIWKTYNLINKTHSQSVVCDSLQCFFSCHPDNMYLFLQKWVMFVFIYIVLKKHKQAVNE